MTMVMMMMILMDGFPLLLYFIASFLFPLQQQISPPPPPQQEQQPVFYLPASFFSLESWALAATIWAGFGSLIIIPLIQLIRKRRLTKINEYHSIKERIEDLCHRLGDVEHWITKHDEKTSKIEDRIDNLLTDVRVLEAIGERNQEQEDAEQEKQQDDNRLNKRQRRRR